MSNPNQKYKKPATVVHQSDYPSWLKYALLSGILIITFGCYHYTLSNQFTNWDDYLYVYQNSFIKEFSPQNLKVLLFGVPTQSNYHPLTMLSLALNWHYSGLSPQAYYATQIILHLLNTVLVFFLSLALLQAMVKKGYGEIKGIPYLAGLCALWHGIHPMHVESVSWLAERKDVLYLFFYLIGLLLYVKYIIENKRALLFLVFLFYVLSLLSKPMAIIFPLSLFSIDILLKSKLEWRLLYEKIPFLLTAVVFGFIAYSLQNTSGAVTNFQTFTLLQRVSIAGHNYLMYLLKLFVPINLCSYYPYPKSTNILPGYFYLAPFVAIGITAGLLYIAYKKEENYFRVTLFGFSFYFFNVAMILQFVSAGPTIIADRYSYASYFGVTFMLVYFIYILIDKMPALKTIVLIILGIFSSALAYLCEARTVVWHNSETLWTDVIEKYPHRIIQAYACLGDYYFIHTEDYNKASANYMEAIKLKTKEQSVYSYMGIIMRKKKQYDSSIYYYSLALKMDSTDLGSYTDRTADYLTIGKYAPAITDCKRALKLSPDSKTLLYYLAGAYLNSEKFDSAIKYYNLLIQLSPPNANYLYNRGLAEFDKGAIKPAMDDFTKSLTMTPHDSLCIFYLSKAYASINDYSTAYKYALMAQDANYPLTADYLSILKNKLKKRSDK